ncbi:MAG: hypothetical protein ABIF10_07615 [Candidatus Woesearchaeota archaeon]
MDEKEYISEWIRQYLESRNTIFKTIESITSHDQYDLYIKHKTKDQYVIAEPFFGNNTLGRLSSDKHLILAGLNTEENFQFMTENWKELCKYPHLTIYLINPMSEPDKKWIIVPYTHHRVCDNASLKAGLRAMFETVQPLTQQKIKSLIKQKQDF